MTDPADDLDGFADATIQILVALSDGPRHGYAIMAEVERETGRPLRPGTLYAALARLERRGLIEALPAADRRHPYRLTPLGVQRSPRPSTASRRSPRGGANASTAASMIGGARRRPPSS